MSFLHAIRALLAIRIRIGGKPYSWQGLTLPRNLRPAPLRELQMSILILTERSVSPVGRSTSTVASAMGVWTFTPFF